MTCTAAQFDYLRAVVLEQSAIVLDPGKGYLVDSRLGPIARELGIASIGDMLDVLRTKQDRELRRRIVEAMTTNETSFFRDQHPFDALREHVLPSLIKERAARRSLQIWCAACSTGQEPYSIAMLMAEHFPVLADWQVRITATDLAEDILARAREGSFNQLEMNRGLPAPLMVKHFAREGLRWRAKPKLRERIEFRQLNLAGTWPSMTRMDLVFLRNVLIYFDVPTKRKILNGVTSLLQPDGYLFLGSAETTLGVTDDFARHTIGSAICYLPKQSKAARV